MARYDEVSVYLTAEQYVVLAANAGMEDMLGTFRHAVSFQENQDVLYVIQQMHRCGILDENNQVTSPCRQVMQRLSAADRVICLYRDAASGPELTAYLGPEGIVESEVSENDENAARFILYEESGFVEILLEKGGFPEKGESPRPDPFPEDYLDQMDDFIAKGSFPTSLKLGSRIELYDLKTHVLKNRLAWVKKGVQDYLLSAKEGSYRAAVFSREELVRLLKAYLKPERE